MSAHIKKLKLVQLVKKYSHAANLNLETRSQKDSPTSQSQTTLCLSRGWSILPHKKEKLKSILYANKQMVSLTTDDCRTSLQNINCIVVACH
jgi:hypothetical protein